MSINDIIKVRFKSQAQDTEYYLISTVRDIRGETIVTKIHGCRGTKLGKRVNEKGAKGNFLGLLLA